MRFLRSLCIVAVGAVLVLSAADSEAAGKKKNNSIQGTITDAVAGKESEDGVLTVKVKPGKKDPAGEAKEVKIKVAKDTEIKKTVGKKQNKQVVDAAFSDLTIGQSVAITLRPGSSDQAAKIMLGGKKKK